MAPHDPPPYDPPPVSSDEPVDDPPDDLPDDPTDELEDEDSSRTLGLILGFSAILGAVAIAGGVLIVLQDPEPDSVPTVAEKAPVPKNGCSALPWRPAEDAVESILPDGAAARFPLTALEGCLSDRPGATDIRVWFDASGNAMGLGLIGDPDRHIEDCGCVASRIRNARVPALLDADYTIMDFNVVVEKNDPGAEEAEGVEGEVAVGAEDAEGIEGAEVEPDVQE